MHTYSLPRFFFVALTFAFIGIGLLAAPAAAGTTTWSDTISGEDEFVQACTGFDITTSYTTNRTFKLVENGIGDQVVERMYVSYVGALANDATGQTLPYDGQFARISDFHRGTVTITDFALRIGLPPPGDFTVTFTRQEMDLVANPAAVLHAVAQSVLESNFCALLGPTFGGSIASAPQAPQPFNMHTENSPLPQSVSIYTENSVLPPQSVNFYTENSVLPRVASLATDGMTRWSELDPCDTSPPGKRC